MELVSAAEMRALDRAAIQDCKISSLRLMENAGMAVVKEMEQCFGRLRGKTVTVLAGKGQNGGDGLVVARILRQRGWRARVGLLWPASMLTSDATRMLRKYKQAGGRTYPVLGPASIHSAVAALLGESDVLIDAIFGTGLNAPIEGPVADVIQVMNKARRRIVAVDIPSGLDADSGEILGTAVQAFMTVTLARPKRGLFLGEGPNIAGIIRVGDIGIPEELIARAGIPLKLLDAAGVGAFLPVRKPGAHKGSFGHAGIIAGSSGKTGAAAMAALGALRSGAGLVSVAVPEGLNAVLEAKLLEAMTFPVAETPSHAFSKAATESLIEFASAKTAVAIGPGIGSEPETVGLVHDLVAQIKQPLVIDADGINALAGYTHILRRAQAPVILTPHPGEMARLLGIRAADVQKDRLGVAGRFAREFNVHVVLKGAGTVVAGPDGSLAVNPTGNPGMATGGTGDVLTGMTVGFLAQGVAPLEAASLAAFLHGMAGDIAAARQGEIGMIARDLIDAIPQAIQKIQCHSTNE
jgi:NAD(P)H-hydrate epimerase